MTNPWDALGELDAHVHEPGFQARWRAFLRACSVLVLPDLPPEVQEWVTAADEFEKGLLTADGLTAVRVRAWQFHDACRDSKSRAELSGMRVVMYRLWPPDEPKRWYEAAGHFLAFCAKAGLREEQWWPLLRAQFPEVLGWETSVEPTDGT